MRRFSGRRIRARWRAGAPVVTAAIIGVCVALWLVQTVTYLQFPRLYMRLMAPLAYVPVAAHAEPWSWMTSMFLHAPGTVMHILFNMVALWSVGPVLERMMGHGRFLAAYLICGLGGAVGISLWCRLAGDWTMSAYGASGALFGLFAALLVVHRRMGADVRSMLVWMALNFAMPLLMPSIAWQAHVGGFVVGGALTWLLVSGVPAWRRWSLTRRMWVYGGALSVVLVALFVAL